MCRGPHVQEGAGEEAIDLPVLEDAVGPQGAEAHQDLRVHGPAESELDGEDREHSGTQPEGDRKAFEHLRVT